MKMILLLGAIWTKAPTNFDWWEVDITFRITGRGRIGADGMVMSLLLDFYQLRERFYLVLFSRRHFGIQLKWVIMMVQYLVAQINGSV